MPRYYLHIYNSFGMVEDEEGQELAGPDAARAVAIEGARSLMSSEVLTGELDLRGRIDVTDAERRPILTIQFSDAVNVKTGEMPLPEGER